MTITIIVSGDPDKDGYRWEGIHKKELFLYDVMPPELRKTVLVNLVDDLIKQVRQNAWGERVVNDAIRGD